MKILFIGYDARYKIVIDTLKMKNDVYTLGYDDYNVGIGSLNSINEYDIVVLPMSGIKNGYASNVKVDCSIFDNYNGIIYTGIKKGLSGNVESFLDDKEICKENTMITVDGIMDRIKDIDKVIICILGYGNIGSKLYDRLVSDYKVVVGVKEDEVGCVCNSFSTSNKKDLEYYLISSDLIINTVPLNIIDEDILNKITGYFLDIASYPYGINEKDVNKYRFKYDLYSSIPSKYAPLKAGKVLLKKF